MLSTLSYLCVFKRSNILSLCHCKVYNNVYDVIYILSAVRAVKQISERLAHVHCEPPLAPVFLAIMNHVAALTKSLQVPRPVVGRVMIKMRGCDHNLCHPDG
jgi:hypothetical protein